MSLEEIKSPDEKTVAIVVRKDFRPDGVKFISKTEYPLQVGVNSYSQGSTIKPHSHIEKEVTVKTIQEFVYIKCGDVLVNLYDGNWKVFKSVNLSSGDLIFFVRGGHGFEIKKDTTIIEVKQGPYFGKAKDKEMIQ